MSQYDFGTINPETKSGSALASDLNGFRDAQNSSHKGVSRPAYVKTGMIWIDDSALIWGLKIHDGTADVLLANINPLNHSINLPQLIPVGAVMGFDLDAPPEGWIAGDGSAISRTTYAALDTAKYVGDANNATATAWYRCADPANPNSTRSVTGGYLVTRDLRGVFPRFLDRGRGIDAGRQLGSEQADAFQGHRLGVVNGAGSFLVNTTLSANAQMPTNTDPGNMRLDATTGDPITDGINGTPRTAAETRPVNVALLGCIKT